MCKELEEAELKKGDILLYSFINKPDFVLPDDPSKMEPAEIKKLLMTDFGVLIDRLICYAEGSTITHAALVYDHKTGDSGKTEAVVAEATLPYCQFRNPAGVKDLNTVITVRRLPEGLDGSAVLKYLPKMDDKQTGYAMAQAVMAALICMFRLRVAKDDPILNKLIILLKLLSYPIGAYLDKFFPFNKGDEKPFFCSQLVAYCYDMTAMDTGINDYYVKTPASTPFEDTLINFIINHGLLSENLLQDNEEPEFANALAGENILEIENALQSPDIALAIADIVGDNKLKGILENQNGLNLYANALSDEKCVEKSLPAIKKLLEKLMKAYGISNANSDSESFKSKLERFHSSFIMPSDLENVFERIGIVVHEK